MTTFRFFDMHTIHVMDAPGCLFGSWCPRNVNVLCSSLPQTYVRYISLPKCQNNLNVLRKSSRRCCKAENSCVPVCIISIRIGANLYSSHNGKQTFYQQQLVEASNTSTKSMMSGINERMLYDVAARVSGLLRHQCHVRPYW